MKFEKDSGACNSFKIPTYMAPGSNVQYQMAQFELPASFQLIQIII